MPQYMGKIRKYSSLHFRQIPGYEAKDMENDLLETLWRACEKYDPNAGRTFNSFFWELVKNQAISLHRKVTAQKRAGDAHWVELDADALTVVIAGAEDELIARIDARQEFERRFGPVEDSVRKSVRSA